MPTDALSREMFAWYSQMMADHLRRERLPLCWYAGLDGKPVLVTMVSATREHGAKWPDVQYRGRVRGYVRMARWTEVPDEA